MKSICIEGIKERLGKEVRVKIIKEQDKLSRTEIENDVVNGLVLITAKEAWTFFPLRSPATNKIPDEELAALQTEMDIAGPLLDYIAKGHKAELLGKETVEDNTCYKIKLTTKTGREMMFWVDAATYLINQSSGMPIGGSTRVDNGNLTLYKNYKEVEGVKFAHTYQTKTMERGAPEISGEIFFYKIQVNQTIDSKMFLPE